MGKTRMRMIQASLKAGFLESLRIQTTTIKLKARLAALNTYWDPEKPTRTAISTASCIAREKNTVVDLRDNS